MSFSQKELQMQILQKPIQSVLLEQPKWINGWTREEHLIGMGVWMGQWVDG
jgi:hypothetical protein